MDIKELLHLIDQAINRQQPTETHNYFVDFNTMLSWYEPFNCATFYNWDPTNPVYVNDHLVPPLTYYTIDLKVNQVNKTRFIINCKNSPTAKTEIIYTQLTNIPT